MKTSDYKAKQEMARALEGAASVTRNDHQGHECAQDDIARFCEKVKKLPVFAAKIAETVLESVENPYSFNAAKISSKQAWILACAAVDNNIEFRK